MQIFLYVTEEERATVHTSENPWDEFTFAVDLDVAGKYWMFWTPDDQTETITFEVVRSPSF